MCLGNSRLGSMPAVFGYEVDEQAACIEQHIDACAEAVGRGLSMQGLFVCTLLDNFKRAWGISRRCGLVDGDTTQVRALKSGPRYVGFLAEVPTR